MMKNVKLTNEQTTDIICVMIKSIRDDILCGNADVRERTISELRNGLYDWFLPTEYNGEKYYQLIMEDKEKVYKDLMNVGVKAHFSLNKTTNCTSGGTTNWNII